VEAKYFSFSVKSEGSDLRLEERRKGFCGVIFLGVQASAWLLATIKEAMKASGRGLVKYFREDVKALMVQGGENKSGRYIEVVVFAEGGQKGTVWLPEGRKGGGWARVADEMRKLISFLGPKDRTLGSEVSSSDCLGGSSSRMGGSPPSYAVVVRWVVVSHVKYGFDSGLRVLHVDLRGLDLFPESWCREVDDGRVAVNCFELEKQPHGSTELSVLLPCSRDSPFVPMDLGLLHRPLGKKETHVSHSAQGAKPAGPAHLNSNLRAWIKLYVSFNRVLGRALGKLLGRAAGSGMGSKRRGDRLGRFLPKPISIASFMSKKHTEGVGKASSVFLGCPPRPESTSPTVSGEVLVLSSSGRESSSL
jgi:hypothetical protein